MSDNKILDKLKRSIKSEESFDKKAEEVAENLPKMKKGPITEIWGKVQKLWRVVRDKSIPWYDKIIPLVALLYLVMPIDLFPDFLPGGLVDDAGVILAAFAAVADLVAKKYKK